MRRVAVIGVGVTKFGRHERTSAELFAEAAADAIVDADVSPSMVQALYYGNVTGGEAERQLHMGPQAATILGVPTIPTTRFETACATSHAAFRHAVMDIASGVSDVVLVGGAERIMQERSDSAREVGKKAQFVSLFGGSLSYVFNALSILLVIVVGAAMVINRGIPFGIITAMAAYTAYIGTPLGQAAALYNNFLAAVAGAARADRCCGQAGASRARLTDFNQGVDQ